jgi:hypothetical protein
MATFYVGKRPVLRGRNSNEFVNGFKGVEGTYSNYSLWGPGLLTGAPDNDHTPGTGYAPHGLTLTRRYRGLDTKNTLDAPGLGTRLDDHRFRPLENKAAGNNLVFKSGYGHEANRDVDYANWSNLEYGGLTASRTLVNVGHARRAEGATGTANSFGAFDGFIYKGVTARPLDDSGQDADDREYGSERVNEWFGVPSSQALNI